MILYQGHKKSFTFFFLLGILFFIFLNFDFSLSFHNFNKKHSWTANIKIQALWKKGTQQKEWRTKKGALLVNKGMKKNPRIEKERVGKFYWGLLFLQTVPDNVSKWLIQFLKGFKYRQAWRIISMNDARQVKALSFIFCDNNSFIHLFFLPSIQCQERVNSHLQDFSIGLWVLIVLRSIVWKSCLLTEISFIILIGCWGDFCLLIFFPV